MIATAEIETVAATPIAPATPVVPAVPRPSDVLVGHDVDRERELDAVAAGVEGAAEGLAVFLLLALFGVAFVVAALTGVLA